MKMKRMEKSKEKKNVRRMRKTERTMKVGWMRMRKMGGRV